MMQIIPFKKEINFKTMISKITSISLEHTLKLTDDYNINGDFVVSGTYKMTEASQLDEEFSYKVPIEITIDHKYDTSNLSLEIDDFTYEILNEECLLLNIDLCIDHLELKQLSEKVETLFENDDYSELDKTLQELETDLEKELVREENNNLFLETSVEKDLEVPINFNYIDEMKDTVQNHFEENNLESSSLFTAFKNTDETFSTYSIYIIREGDNLDTVIDKYKTTRDILSEYNDLSDIRIGTKIIVPSNNE